jgi:ribonucleoside-diphosphate reductase alpha chain
MKIERFYTQEGVNPFDMFKYETRKSVVREASGKTRSEIIVEVPIFWSQTATDIFAQKYLRKSGLIINGKPSGESSVKQVVHRLAECWKQWGVEYNYFSSEQDAKVYYDEMIYMLIAQIGSPNSPQWFNTGLNTVYGLKGPFQGHWYVDAKTEQLKQSEDAYSRPAPHACFIQGVSDHLLEEGGIFDLILREARVFKFGGGSGTNFSYLRSKGEAIQGGGFSSGVMSFLKVFDRAAGAIKSGGTTRRAAKMICLDIDHPEILDFIDWKMREEDKVALLWAGKERAKTIAPEIWRAAKDNDVTALQSAILKARKAKFPITWIQKIVDLGKQKLEYTLQDFSLEFEDEAYETVAGQNSNNSVRIPNKFFDILEANGEWDLVARVSKKTVEKVPAKEIWDRIVKAAWASADPGVQFDDTINEWNTCAKSGRIDSSNPCCVTGDTLLALADGREPTPIKDLVGQSVKVYSCDDKGQVVVRDADQIRVSNRNVDVFRVTLDDGSHLDVTDYHNWLVKNFSDDAIRKTMTKDLKVGDSLVPFHKKQYENWLDLHDSKRKSEKPLYWAVNTNVGYWRPEHCLFVESKIGRKLKKGELVHHQNFNGLDNDWNNLLEMTKEEHTSYHASLSVGERNGMFGKHHTEESRELMKESSKLRWDKEEEHEKAQKSAKKAYETTLRNGNKAGRPNNAEVFKNICVVCQKEFLTKYAPQRTCSRNCCYRDFLRSQRISESLVGKDFHKPENFDELMKAISSRPDQRVCRSIAAIQKNRNCVLRMGKWLLNKGFSVNKETWEDRRVAFKEETNSFHSVQFQKVEELFGNNWEQVEELSRAFNHRVVSIEYLGKQDVYNLRVHGTHHVAYVTKSSKKDGITHYTGVITANSEYMFLTNTACNLASLNLVKFLKDDGTFDVRAYEYACRLWTLTLELSIVMAQFPSKEIAQGSYDFRSLGLGYANLGSLLMRMALPYGSAESCAWTSLLTAIMHGVAYRTSSEMAKELGAFRKYEENKACMMKVVQNHRESLLQRSRFSELTIRPVRFQESLLPKELVSFVRKIWDEVLVLGDQYGFRNAQVTLLAPTGTIALTMDCDTTGIEPDFALIKFKKLAGGGFLKLVNLSVEPALKRLKYTNDQIHEILQYVNGTGTLYEVATTINAEVLKTKGLNIVDLQKIEESLPFASSLDEAINLNTVSRKTLEFLGFAKEELDSNNSSILTRLGFSFEEISMSNEIICGRKTIEGAPHLKAEHYAIFDCASKSGPKGTRFLSPEAHLNVMSAAQPFLSGAISKTINLSTEASVDDVKKYYRLAHNSMLKAVAVYRDGCKLSQPLNTALLTGFFDHEDAVEIGLVGKSERRKLPPKRHGITIEAAVGGQKVFLRTGEYPDHTLGEVFFDAYKVGASFQGLLACFSILLSKALQYGVPLEDLVDTFTFTRFEPAGVVTNDETIKNATSLIDYLFRNLAINYLGRDDLAHVQRDTERLVKDEMSVSSQLHKVDKHTTAKQQGYTGEACKQCGSMKVKRAGTCSVCEVCGQTTGCS